MSDAAAGRGLDIVEVDPHDGTAFRDWHATYLEAETRGRPFATPWMFEEALATAQAPAVGARRLFYSGRVDGTTACVAQVILPLKDNLDLVELRIYTLPEQRRRGHATRMLQRVVEVAAQQARGTLVSMVAHPYDLGAAGAGEPGVEFLTCHGFSHSLGEVQSACPLPVPREVLAELAAEAAAHHEGYALRSFVDRCPDELVDPFGRLLGSLMAEAPAGELVLEAEVFDEERIRAEEAMMAAAGRTTYSTVAFDPTGEAVAYTQLAVPRHDPGKAYQWGTLVDPKHRGHRLGLAVKAANLALLQENEQALSAIITYNAEVNDHMIAVNRRFGFAPVARLAEFVKPLSD